MLAKEMRWANFTPFMSNHARYFISSCYILKKLEAKFSKETLKKLDT